MSSSEGFEGSFLLLPHSLGWVKKHKCCDFKKYIFDFILIVDSREVTGNEGREIRNVMQQKSQGISDVGLLRHCLRFLAM